MTKLWIKYPTAQQLSSRLPKFPMTQSLQMLQSDTNADHLQCFSSLPRLNELCLLHCFSSTSKLQPRDFTHLSQITALHLHFQNCDEVTPADLPGSMFQMLKKLQHVSITGMHQRKAAFVELACLPELSSFCADRVTLNITLLSDLTKLHITEYELSPVFGSPFSKLTNLKALHVGSKYGTSAKVIMGLHIFPQLASLVLQGPIDISQFDANEPKEYIRQQSRWNALTSLTSVKHLELKKVDHTYQTFWTLGCMTQLTCLQFSSCNPFLKAQPLDNGLLGLSSLTCLNKLECKFLCSAFQDRGQVHDPELSRVGDLLRYSLSFCTIKCTCLFGCKCTMPSDADIDSSRSSQYRSCFNLIL